ncbi:AAA domain-containing protein [Roseivirga pacifica]|uniref:AAA domain-containing protein n=1 Tax=Roseivirga pacifica TaxID=1267423 RepID=UPI003BAB6008
MRDILQSYLKRLTNLSGNNRSLALLKLPADQFIDLHEFNFVDGNPSWRIMDELITGKNKIKLAPVSDPRDPHSNKLSTRLKKLVRREEFIFQESGARDLYIGWPFIHGKFNDDTIVRAPLCFFPMELKVEKNHWVLYPKQEVNISFNKSLLLAFAHYNQVELMQDLVEYTFDDYEKDSTAFRNVLYETIRDSLMQLRFDRAYYADELIAFEPTTRKEFEEEHRTGEVNVKMEAVLGIFPQADSYLVPDYDFMLAHEDWGHMDDFFANKSLDDTSKEDGSLDLERYFLNMVKEEESYTPLPIDAHQENALNAVKKGNSIVVQGPPGTGKSQLIGNLAADFIARGKKVLVVSQKRAALDVVYQRLKAIDIQDFIGLVHDFKSDRHDIYKRIALQIERLQDYSRSNNNLDAIQLDRNFKKASLEIEETIDQLDEYKAALFKDTECGLSAKELYLTSDPDAEAISLTQEYNHFHFNELHEFVKKLDLYIDYAKKLDVEDHPWSDRVSFAKFGTNDLKQIVSLLEEIPKEAKAYTKAISKIVNEEVDFDSCRTFSDNLEKLKEINSYLKNKDIYAVFKPMVGFNNSETEPLWIKNTRNLINKCFEGAGVEQSIESGKVGEVQVILKQRLDAKSSVWKSFRWNFSKEKLRLARILVANGLSDDKAGLQVLTEKLDNRLNLQHQLTKINSVGWISEVPRTTSQEELNEWFDRLDMAVQAKLRFSSFSNFREYFPLHQLTAKELRAVINEIHDALKDLPSKRQLWNKYVLPRQIDLLLGNDDFLKALRRTIKRDFDTLCELDQLRDAFHESELGVVDKLTEYMDRDKKELLSLFDNSIRLAWIDHLESKHPILRSVSTLKFDKLTTDLREAVHLKQEASQQILLQRIREQTYEGIEFNRLNNRVTYRDLEHQVNKQRRIWPLRRIISNFSEELFKLIPCWLASPETVSAIFPMEPLFDLVIFDEASQCFAERGLPAIYRGKQVVVAGDSQQLKPFDLYRVRWEEDSDEMALEAESLLDLTKQYLMEVHLKGHYRSQSLALLDFSNQHFYKGKLQMLPEFGRANSVEPAIEYIQVEDGVWEKQTNQQEAEKVLDLLKQYAKPETELSVGVVTFNARQQELINELIEESELSFSEKLFVKNIENVQGDERDIIIFSLAYAKNKQGKMNVQFGSLNQAGGENRLNVAISRAKQKVFLVTSIAPNELKVEQTKNEGPKLLKAYLSYAQEVSEKQYTPHVERKEEHPQAWYLSQKLAAWEKEYPFRTALDLPYADITLMRRGKYLGLLSTDDNSYYESSSNKETFVYNPDLYEAKNWPHRIIHSREYWIDKESVKEKIGRFVEVHNG